ncbi:PIN domain-containing protein [Corallococcus interemptor]|uniref:PIN domain-containing protein n=1 Tax=Corallococcus interemptor TaxID=2316720 RepID=UPI003CFC5517
MRVYVETNFILELAYEQEQVESCEEILQLAETGALRLAIPAFCFIEPMDKLRRDREKHRQLADGFRQEFRERQRGRIFSQAQRQAWAEVQSSLTAITQDAEQRVASIRERLLRCSDILPVSERVIEHAAALWAEELMPFPDAVVLASVLAGLQKEAPSGEASCFLNRNQRDFETPTVEELLEQQHCVLKVRFDAGLGFIKAALKARFS